MGACVARNLFVRVTLIGDALRRTVSLFADGVHNLLLHFPPNQGVLEPVKTGVRCERLEVHENLTDKPVLVTLIVGKSLLEDLSDDAFPTGAAKNT